MLYALDYLATFGATIFAIWLLRKKQWLSGVVILMISLPIWVKAFLTLFELR